MLRRAVPALTVEIIRQGRFWLVETSRHDVIVTGPAADAALRGATSFSELNLLQPYRRFEPRLWARSETPQAALAYAKIIAAGESIRAADEAEHEYFEAVIVALNRIEFVTGPDPRD